jgi:predicted MFS family arabinose efflux permease
VTPRALAASLAVIASYDELWSGIAVVAAPGVEASAGVGHDGYTLWVFAVPLLLSALVEAPIALWSDRLPRRRLAGCGLFVLAAALALCALPGPIWLLSLGLALAGAASGVACGAAQAELVAQPGGAARAMSRWVAFANAGDLLCPLVVATALHYGGSYRAALAWAACLGSAQALLLLCTRAPRPAPNEPADVDDAATLRLREALRHALRQRRLWGLLFASACCCLLDELVVALAALRLHGELGWSGARIAAAMTGMSIGGLLGALLAERAVVRGDPRVVLALSALVSLAALGLLVFTGSGWVAALALVLVGLSAAPHYPLLKAAAYEALPGRPGLVNALAQTLVAFEVAIPVVLGVIAARFGVGAALAALSLQPLVVLAACWFRRSPRTFGPERLLPP